MSRTSAEQAAFAQKLKDTLETLMNSYGTVLQACKVGVRSQGREAAERDRLQLTTHAAGLVAEAQALYKMIAEIKLSVMTSNLEALNEIVEKRNEAFEKQQSEAETQLRVLEADIDCALDRLEKHYYSSPYR